MLSTARAVGAMLPDSQGEADVGGWRGAARAGLGVQAAGWTPPSRPDVRLVVANTLPGAHPIPERISEDDRVRLRALGSPSDG